jgi:hypothetical protein
VSERRWRFATDNSSVKKRHSAADERRYTQIKNKKLLPLQGEGGDGDGLYISTILTHPHLGPPLEGEDDKYEATLAIDY